MYCYKGIIIYSNTDQLESVHEQNGIYYGLKWQCVELARRYLIQKHSITFKSIKNAYDLFYLSSFQTLNGKYIPITCIPNGSSILPHIGSLLIWDKKYNGTGHVAIITQIYPYSIQVIEQNTDTPIRTLFVINFKNNIWIDDTDILGWINYK